MLNRQKKTRLIVTFASVTEAMQMEETCKKANINGRLIPTPKELSGGCGLAWSCAPEEEAPVMALLNSNEIHFTQVSLLELF
ncbi:DUF3343 domain-containing protein [Eubacteriales bacterium OttesenSCG-928-K08]|nr:DUF3343 domain-containing protein [Eubacteriales bacterium OttesenSCG-928-K08]